MWCVNLRGKYPAVGVVQWKFELSKSGFHNCVCSGLQAHQDGTLQKLLDNNTVTYDFDLIVIGGGSGGLACSKVLSLVMSHPSPTHYPGQMRCDHCIGPCRACAWFEY